MSVLVTDTARSLYALSCRLEELEKEIDQDRLRIWAMQQARAAKLEEAKHLEALLRQMGRVVAYGT